MKINYLYIAFAFFCFGSNFAQNTIICPALEMTIRIENSNYIPEIENNEDSTITLIFNDSEITNLFSDYTIYGFYQISPTSSNYIITCNSKEILNTINDNIDSSIMTVNIESYPVLPQSTIDSFDNKIIQYEWYCFKDLENVEAFCDASYTEVPSNFNFILETHYDPITDVIVMQSQGLTPCENIIELGFKAGTSDFSASLSLYFVNLLVVNNDIENAPLCDDAETFLMNMLGIGCVDTLHFGDVRIETFPDDTSIIRFVRDTDTNIYDRASFRYNTLSVESIQDSGAISIIKKNDNQAELVGVNETQFRLTVYELSGKNLNFNYEKNSKFIDISQLSSGLYIFKVSLPNNKLKVIKFLK